MRSHFQQKDSIGSTFNDNTHNFVVLWLGCTVELQNYVFSRAMCKLLVYSSIGALCTFAFCLYWLCRQCAVCGDAFTEPSCARYPNGVVVHVKCAKLHRHRPWLCGYEFEVRSRLRRDWIRFSSSCQLEKFRETFIRQSRIVASKFLSLTHRISSD